MRGDLSLEWMGQTQWWSSTNIYGNWKIKYLHRNLIYILIFLQDSFLSSSVLPEIFFFLCVQTFPKNSSPLSLLAFRRIIIKSHSVRCNIVAMSVEREQFVWIKTQFRDTISWWNENIIFFNFISFSLPSSSPSSDTVFTLPHTPTRVLLSIFVHHISVICCTHNNSHTNFSGTCRKGIRIQWKIASNKEKS